MLTSYDKRYDKRSGSRGMMLTENFQSSVGAGPSSFVVTTKNVVIHLCW